MAGSGCLVAGYDDDEDDKSDGEQLEDATVGRAGATPLSSSSPAALRRGGGVAGGWTGGGQSGEAAAQSGDIVVSPRPQKRQKADDGSSATLGLKGGSDAVVTAAPPTNGSVDDNDIGIGSPTQSSTSRVERRAEPWRSVSYPIALLPRSDGDDGAAGRGKPGEGHEGDRGNVFENSTAPRHDEDDDGDFDMAVVEEDCNGFNRHYSSSGSSCSSSNSSSSSSSSSSRDAAEGTNGFYSRIAPLPPPFARLPTAAAMGSEALQQQRRPRVDEDASSGRTGSRDSAFVFVPQQVRSKGKPNIVTEDTWGLYSRRR